MYYLRREWDFTPQTPSSASSASSQTSDPPPGIARPGWTAWIGQDRPGPGCGRGEDEEAHRVEQKRNNHLRHGHETPGYRLHVTAYSLQHRRPTKGFSMNMHEPLRAECVTHSSSRGSLLRLKNSPCPRHPLKLPEAGEATKFFSRTHSCPVC